MLDYEPTNLVQFARTSDSFLWAKYYDRVIQEGFYMPVLVGQKEDGSLLVQDYANVKFMFVSGMTGSGKTSRIKQLLLSLLSSVPSELLRIWVFDPKNDYSSFSPLVNYFKDIKSIKSAVCYLSALRKVKQRLLEETGHTSIMAYNQSVGVENDHFMPIDLIIEEEAIESFEDDEKSISMLSKIYALGRSAGVWSIKIGQTFRASMMGKHGKGLISQFSTRISGLQNSKLESQIQGDDLDLLNLKDCDMVFSNLHCQQKTRLLRVSEKMLDATVKYLLGKGVFFKDNYITTEKLSRF